MAFHFNTYGFSVARRVVFRHKKRIDDFGIALVNAAQFFKSGAKASNANNSRLELASTAEPKCGFPRCRRGTATLLIEEPRGYTSREQKPYDDNFHLIPMPALRPAPL